MPLRIVIHGAAGRMGQRLVALALADPELKLVAALEAAGHPRLGQDAGAIAGAGPCGVAVFSSLDVPADVAIDFSVPQGTQRMVALAVERRLPLVVATTGLEHDQQELVRRAADAIPVVWAPSMSLAVNVAMKLSAVAGRSLAAYASGADVEIIERHHRFKEDAPSGTALKFGEIIAGAMGQTRHQHGRSGRPGQRPRDEIGYHAVRTGDNPGEHTIVFGMLGETLEITVRASNRDCYAHGALAAARFVASKPPGLYSMADVLGM
jgi:4-hydroxy-tetrahydrodipicolinate reductase